VYVKVLCVWSHVFLSVYVLFFVSICLMCMYTRSYVYVLRSYVYVLCGSYVYGLMCMCRSYVYGLMCISYVYVYVLCVGSYGVCLMSMSYVYVLCVCRPKVLCVCLMCM